ncbi:hypothetical protein Scep_006351 [Stephania cephalantha]|uniref:Uncharacterized protein n=1 Tax=Stephania cephalantha TaxID=152367 RepID=A0AAP0PM50_9MAGN
MAEREKSSDREEEIDGGTTTTLPTRHRRGERQLRHISSGKIGVVAARSEAAGGEQGRPDLARASAAGRTAGRRPAQRRQQRR